MKPKPGDLKQLENAQILEGEVLMSLLEEVFKGQRSGSKSSTVC